MVFWLSSNIDRCFRDGFLTKPLRTAVGFSWKMTYYSFKKIVYPVFVRERFRARGAAKRQKVQQQMMMNPLMMMLPQMAAQNQPALDEESEDEAKESKDKEKPEERRAQPEFPLWWGAKELHRVSQPSSSISN